MKGKFQTDKQEEKHETYLNGMVNNKLVLKTKTKQFESGLSGLIEIYFVADSVNKTRLSLSN